MTSSEGAPAALSSREVRKVIFASSLGTVFEWYDFYIYATLAPFFAALFFPQGQRDRGAAGQLRDLRGRLPGAARSARWCSAASAIWSAASTPSSSPSW